MPSPALRFPAWRPEYFAWPGPRRSVAPDMPLTCSRAFPEAPLQLRSQSLDLPMFPRFTAAPARPRVLIVDDEPAIRIVLRTLLNTGEYEVIEAPDGDTALELIRAFNPDAILCDLLMPGIDGIELLRRVKEIDDTVAFVLVTGAGTTRDAVEALRLQADDYLAKPFQVDEVLHSLSRALAYRRLLRENRGYQRELEKRVREQTERMEQLFVDALLTIANAVETRDGYTGGHVERVTLYAVATGAALGLEPERLRSLAAAALLHDVGKIGIPDHVLTKPGRLTPEEYQVMQGHPAIGAAILRQSPFLQSAVDGVLHHHERWDGTGYPGRLAGERISVEGRILAVVDAYDAMVTTRPYRERCPAEAAVDELRRCAGSQFDPAVVEAFLHSMREGFSGGTEVPCVHAVRQRSAAAAISLAALAPSA
jgi:putative two-component system response regulator